MVIYTDASKTEVGVGCSITTVHGSIGTYKIPSICSVHTGELYAILQAFKHVQQLANTHIAICTDSLSSIHSIKNTFTNHPLVQDIHDIYQQLRRQNTTVTITWVPSHVGIIGNEKADCLAKEAASTATATVNLQLCNDLKASLKKIIRYNWQIHWSQIMCSLREIQPILNQFTCPDLSRKNMAVIRRLRIGHTRLTHGYLMTSSPQPNCQYCHVKLCIKHILVECPYFAPRRLQLGIHTNYTEILNSDNQVRKVIKFLEEEQLINRI